MDNFILERQALAYMPKSPRFPPNQPRIIEMLAFPGVQVLDIAGPLQVFASANVLSAKSGQVPYTTRIVAQGAPIVTTSAGLGLVVSALPPVHGTLDTLIVAGGDGVQDAAASMTLLPWVQARAARARRLASVCTGAFVLGAAGLLDGRRAVTHWTECAEFARQFPAVHIETDPIFVRDGSVWTSAGITAGIDLALALVEQDLGRQLALAVARHLVVFLKRPGGQAQFSTALTLQIADEQFGALHNWIAAHLTSDLSLPVLARQARMSERNFSRRYAETTGLTPARAVERLRLEESRRMLSDTRFPIKRIAERCGFRSEETMRRSFLRLLGATPQDYRARFSV